jgi:hypothetical protein
MRERGGEGGEHRLLHPPGMRRGRVLGAAQVQTLRAEPGSRRRTAPTPPPLPLRSAPAAALGGCPPPPHPHPPTRRLLFNEATSGVFGQWRTADVVCHEVRRGRAPGLPGPPRACRTSAARGRRAACRAPSPPPPHPPPAGGAPVGGRPGHRGLLARCALQRGPGIAAGVRLRAGGAARRGARPAVCKVGLGREGPGAGGACASCTGACLPAEPGAAAARPCPPAKPRPQPCRLWLRRAPTPMDEAPGVHEGPGYLALAVSGDPQARPSAL